MLDEVIEENWSLGNSLNQMSISIIINKITIKCN